MKVATVRDSSLPLSIILKQSTIISVGSRKWMTSGSFGLTRAPITPREVSFRYSYGRELFSRFRKG